MAQYDSDWRPVFDRPTSNPQIAINPRTGDVARIKDGWSATSGWIDTPDGPVQVNTSRQDDD
jgi:hypothetical protein